jgi:hypothetical protein
VRRVDPDTTGLHSSKLNIGPYSLARIIHDGMSLGR